MVCSHCNAKIEDGSLYCSHCGKAVQIVPDYNALEDDMLTAIIHGDDVKKDISSGDSDDNFWGSHEDEKKQGLFATKSAKRVAVFFTGIFILLIAAFIAIYMMTHSYSFYINSGKEAAREESYDRAISFYRSALEETDDYGEAYILIADAQINAGYTDEADKTLHKLLKTDPKNYLAFSMLVDLYDKSNDLDGLDSLFDLAMSEDQKKLLDKSVVDVPEFSIQGGEFKDDVLLSITANGDSDIYYTIDGTEPNDHNGFKFEGEPIELICGSTEVKACCVRKDGKVGRIVSEAYTIIYEAPKMPVISPSGGRLTKETLVTITTDSPDAAIYYTWDGTIPTSASHQYTEPILVPEGNSILSVIVIDKHELISPVLQANYIYLP